jgi:hypothetical protein
MNLDTASIARTLVADRKGILASAQAPTAVPGRDPVATCACSIGTMRIRTPHRAESRVASTPSSVTLRLSDPLFGTADARAAAREMTSVVNVTNGKGRTR